MMRWIAGVVWVVVAVWLTPAGASAQGSNAATLGIEQVGATPALAQAVEAAADGVGFRRCRQSLEQQLALRVQQTRKFQVVARADLEQILDEQQLQRVVSDPSAENAVQAYKIAGCRYLLIVTLDDFSDIVEDLRNDAGRLLATRRTVRVGGVAKIYDTTTGVLRETVPVAAEVVAAQEQVRGVDADGRHDEVLYAQVAGDLAQQASHGVLDTVFPARIIAMTGRQATVNRGEGTGIQVGQRWTVYALGEALIDPDTGEDLGSEEVPIGEIEIVEVTARFSRARVIEDRGVARLQIVRQSSVADED